MTEATTYSITVTVYHESAIDKADVGNVLIDALQRGFSDGNAEGHPDGMIIEDPPEISILPEE